LEHPATTLYTPLSLHDALPISSEKAPFLLREIGGNLSGPMGKRASFFADLRRDAVDNGAIINGTTINPATFGIINPFTDVFRIPDRKSTRLNSSHDQISYAVFC